MFLDNFICHSNAGHFSNIMIIMLPKNTTSVLQPCDAGILRWIKHNYRQRLVRNLLVKIENKGK
jgi:DDE superfamily endonuclease